MLMRMRKLMMCLLITAVSIEVNGFAVMWLWHWFLTPVGLPTIGIAHGAGIALLASLLTDHTRVQQIVEEDDIYTAANAIWHALPYPLIILAMGGAVSAFMGPR